MGNGKVPVAVTTSDFVQAVKEVGCGLSDGVPVDSLDFETSPISLETSSKSLVSYIPMYVRRTSVSRILPSSEPLVLHNKPSRSLHKPDEGTQAGMRKITAITQGLGREQITTAT